MRLFNLCVAVYMVFNVDTQHPSPGVESQVSALKSQWTDSSNKESVKYPEMRGKKTLFNQQQYPIHTFLCSAQLPGHCHHCDVRFPHKPQQRQLQNHTVTSPKRGQLRPR